MVGMDWEMRLPSIIGKRIVGAVALEGNTNPPNRVFLVFDDDTHFEFYGDDGWSAAKGCRVGGMEEVKEGTGEGSKYKVIWESCER